jgi:hypothetical protein
VGLSTLKKNKRYRVMIKKLLLTVFLVINLFFASSVCGQAVGDYRSNVNTTGNWTNLTSWQRWNGSSWIEPSAGQGYPGQNIGTGAVLIQAGDVIIVNAVNITPGAIGTFTINGQLVLSDDISLTINTTSLIVTSPSGSILFGKKSDIKLPSNTPLQVSSGGLLGDCSNNNSIFIGTVEVAVCAGPGNSMLTFDQVMDNGGYYVVNVSPLSGSSCGSKTFSFTATASPSSGATIKWYDAATGGTLLLTGTTGSANTYSPTVSSTTTYYVEAAYSGYTTPRTAVVATVNALPVTPTITAGGPTTFCPGGSVTLTSSAGTTYLWSTGATTQSISPTTSGSYTVRVTNAAGCQSALSVATTLTVNALNAPTVGTRTHPTCAVATGSVVLNDLPASGTWTLIRSPGGVSTSGTGTSTTISGLAVGTYTYTVTNASGCASQPSDIVDIKAFVAEINTWRGVLLGWDKSTPPTAEQKIIFDSPDLYTLNSNIVACSCQAKSDVTIKSGHTLTLTNELTVDDLVNVVFEDGASLVQINDVQNDGFIDYQRITESRNSDYTYWSSPVYSLQPLGGITGLFPKSLAGTFYSFDSSINPADWKNESSGTSMTVGKGYIARGPETLLGTQTPPSTQFTTTFYGVPNNGTINIPILHSGASDGTSNLIGNPYPSAIDANAFLSANSTVIEGTIYFWTHNTMIGVGTVELGSGLYPYTGNDYASYNGTGGAAGSGGKIPNGAIAAGQGFFVTSLKASGNAKFENTMRLSGTTKLDKTGINEQFFKTKNPNKSSKTIEKNRVWLNLTNTQGAFKQTLVGYITDATNDYDDRFDGESYDGNEFVDFYSVNQDKNLVIQGRALPFDENDEVPLGYRTTINGAFTISIDQVDGFLTNQAVFIEDKLTNTVFDLKSGNYTFNTVEGTFNDRFVLRYTNTNKTLGTSNFDSLEKSVLVSNKNKQIKIDSSVEMIDKVTVFDLLGRQIYQKLNVNSNELSISNLVSNRQMLMVKTTLQNGKTVTKKVIY